MGVGDMRERWGRGHIGGGMEGEQSKKVGKQVVIRF